jgi:hypothetical protein
MDPLSETWLRIWYPGEEVDAHVAAERARAEAAELARESATLAQWRAASAAGTLHTLLPPDEL